MASDKTVSLSINIAGNFKAQIADFSKSLKAMEDVLKNFGSRIDTFQGSLAKISTEGISNLQSVLGAFSSASTTEFTKVIKSISKDTVISGIQDFAKATKKLEAIELSTLGNTINKLKRLEELKGIDTRGITTRINNLVPSINSLNNVKLNNIGSLVKNLKNLANMDFSKLTQKLQAVTPALTNFGAIQTPKLGTLVNQLKKLEAVDIRKVSTQLRMLQQAIINLDNIVGKSMFAAFVAQMNQAAKTMRDFQKLAQDTAKKIEQMNVPFLGANKGMDALLNRFASFARYRVVSDVINGIRNSMAAVPSVIKEFDQSLKDLQAISGATNLEVSKMSDVIKQVARDTKFSAQEIAEGMITIAQAGFSAAEAINMIGPIAELATGTLSDMALTVDLVTSAMTVFDIQSKDTAMVADVFANAINKSKLNIDKLRTAFNYIGPVAVDAGLSFNETAASMMVLANSGQRASTIGTGLRNVFNVLLSPTNALKEAAAKVGVSLQELDPRVNSLRDILMSLKDVVVDSQVALEVFGKRGSSAALALTRDIDEYDRMINSTKDYGSAAKMAAIQAEGLGVRWKNLKDRVELLGIAMGESGLSGVMGVVVDGMRNLVTAATVFTETVVGKAIVGITGFTTTLLVLGGAMALVRKAWTAMALGKLVAEGSAAAAAITRLRTAFLGLAAAMNLNPWVLAITAVAALVTAVSVGISQFNRFKKELEESVKQAEAFAESSEKINTFKQSIVGVAEGTEEYKNSLVTLVGSLKELAGNTKGVQKEFDAFLGTVDFTTGRLVDGGKALDTFKKALKDSETQQLANALKSANKEVEAGTSAWGRFSAAVSDVDSWLGDLNKSKREVEEVFTVPIKLMEELQSGVKGFADLEDWYKTLTTPMSRLTGEQTRLIKLYKVMNEAAQTFLDNLLNTQQITLDSTISQVLHLGEKLGLTGKELDAVLVKFQRMRDSYRDASFSSGSDWSEQYEGITNVTQAFEKLGVVYKHLELANIELTEADKKRIEQYEEEKFEIAKRRERLQETYKAEITAANGNLAEIDRINKEKLEKEHKLAEDVTELRRKMLEDESALRVIRAVEADRERERAREAAHAQYADNKEMLDKELKLVEENYKKSMNRLRVSPLSDEETFQKFKKQFAVQQKEIELETEKSYTKIAQAEERGNTTRREAEAQRYKIAKENNQKLIDLAQEYYTFLAQNFPEFDKTIEFYKKKVELETKMQDLHQSNAKKNIEIDAHEEKERIRMFQERTQTLTALYAKQREDELHNVSLLAAAGEITHEQTEKKKYDITLEYYNKRKALLAQQINELQSAEGDQQNKKLLEDYIQAQEKNEADILALKRKSILEQVEIIRKGTEQMEELQGPDGKVAQALKKYDEKRKRDTEDLNADIQKIEKDRVDKIRDIEEDIFKVRKDYIKARLDEEKKAAGKLADLDDELKEKIRGVKQRGMSDKEKKEDDYWNAQKQFNEAQKLIQEGIKKGDEVALDRAKDKLKAAADVFQNIDNENVAIAKLRKTYEELKKAQSASDNIKAQEKYADYLEKEKKLQEDIAKVQADAQDKLAEKLRSKNQEMEAEKQRHETEMQNLDKEIAKVKEKVELAKSLMQNAQGEDRTTPQGQATESGTEEAVKRVENSIEGVAEKAKTIGQNLKTGIQEGARGSVPAFEEVFRAVEEDGKTVWTNMTDAQRQSFKDLAEAARSGSSEAFAETGKLGKDAAEEVKLAFNAAAESMKAAFGDASFMDSLIPADAVNRIDEIKSKFKDIFKVDADVSSLQIMQDKITTLQGMLKSGAVTTEEFKVALGNIDAQVKAMGDYKISLGLDGTAKIIKETGEEVVGLSNKIQTSPFELNLDDKKVLDSLKNIEGVSEKVKESLSKPIETKVDTRPLEKAADALDKVDDKKDIDIKAAVKGDREVAALKTLIESMKENMIRAVVQIVGMDQAIKLKNIIDSLKDKTITITTKYETVGAPVQQKAAGGIVFKRLTDRFIAQGSGTKDDVPALLMKDEFVHRSAAVKKYGKDFMYKLNNLQIPTAITRMFRTGGFVGDSVGTILQTFSKGGVVLSSARKKLEEMFLGSGVNINVNNLNITDKINQVADNITTPVGLEGLNLISQNINRNISAFAEGGQMTSSVLTSAELQKIKNNYAKQIATAKSSGQAEIAKVLENERDQLIQLADELKKTLQEIEKTYKEQVKKLTEEHKEKVAKDKKNYEEKLSDEEKKYAEKKFDDDLKYSREDFDYAKDRSEMDEKHNESLKELKDRLALERVAYRKELRDRENSVKDLEKALWDFRFRLSSDAFPAGSSAHLNASTEELIKQHAAYWAKKTGSNYTKQISFDGMDGKSIMGDLQSAVKEQTPSWIRGPRTTYLKVPTRTDPYPVSWRQNNERYKRIDQYKKEREGMLQASREGTGEDYETYLLRNLREQFLDPIESAKLDLDKVRKETPDFLYKQDLDELMKSYNKSLADKELSRSRSLEDRHIHVTRRDAEHKEKIQELKDNYITTEKEDKEALKLKLDEAKTKYLEDIDKTKKDNQDKVTQVKNNTAKEVEKLKQDMQSSMGSLSNEMQEEMRKITQSASMPVLGSPQQEQEINNLSVGYMGMGIDELLRRLSKGLLRFAGGGLVPHTAYSQAGKDSVLSMLMPDEFVMSAKAVQAFGTDFMHSINNLKVPRFAAGGIVSDKVIGGNINKTVYALDLTIGNTHIGELTGDQGTIQLFIDAMERARAGM